MASGQFTTAFARDKPADGQLDRTVLPIPEPKSVPITGLDARNAKAPPRFEVKAPNGAPNVVVVLIDDMGFGQPSTFGGACAMQTLDRLAAGGLRFNNLHVTALCSRTRAVLLSGRNHHTCNVGADEDTPVCEDYRAGEPSRFTGKIQKVTVELK
jgi:arylsulfatase